MNIFGNGGSIADMEPLRNGLQGALPAMSLLIQELLLPICHYLCAKVETSVFEYVGK